MQFMLYSLLFSFIFTASNILTHEEFMAIERMFEYSKSDVIAFADALEKTYQNKSDNKLFLKTFIKKGTSENINLEDVLSIDLGGTWLKLCVLDCDLRVKCPSEKYQILRDGSLLSIDLFDWIATTVLRYLCNMEIEAINGPLVKVAFSFSYPVKMTSLKSGTIMKFTKDFPFKPIDLSVGVDPVIALNLAFKALKMNVECQVIVNDTTATFLASYAEDQDCRMGLVLGTGTNAAFLNENNELVNSEWGQFNSASIKKTQYDVKIAKSVSKDSFANIDCMIGGLKFEEIMQKIFKGAESSGLVSCFHNEHIKDKRNMKVAIFKVMKIRIYTILSIMTVVLYGKSPNYIIGITGSGFHCFADTQMYKKYLCEMYLIIHGEELEDVKIFQEDNTSLVGAAYALIYNGVIPDE